MSRIARSILALGATLTVAACGGGDTTNNRTNNKNNNSGSLKVDAFSASATTVAVGGTVDLAWRISGAEAVSVTIKRMPGTPVIEGATNLEGTVSSGAISETTTFTLEVTGGGQTISSDPVTVTVDASMVQIVSFTASPNPAAEGANVTLAWDTAGATMITILEGTTELHTDTAAQGTFQVTLTDTAHTYTLRAQNDSTSTSETVTVTTETPPEITTFTVSPNTFSGASVDVTITFAATGEAFALTANDMPVAGYNGEAAGNVTVTITETTRFNFTVTGAGQTATETAVVAQAVEETEPNDSKDTATAITGGATGTIEPETDVDFYSFTVPDGGNVFADTTDGMGGCNFVSSITLYNAADDTPVTSALFGGVGDCARLDPLADPAAANLPGGTYYIEVASLSGTGAYALVVVVGAPVCGNSIVETTQSEQCDDGNSADGDGCSSTCQIETAGSVSGIDQDQTFADSIVPASTSDYYQVVLPSDGFILADTGVPTIGSCAEPADTRIFLLDGNFERLQTADDTDDTLCSSLVGLNDDGSALAAGTYWVQVESYAGQAEIANYEVQIRTVAPGCGNNIAEMGEQCDDGNTMAGDGCSATCTLETAGSLSGTGGTVSLTLGAPEDFPQFVAVTVTAGQSITATTTGPNMGACPFETVIGLFDRAFTVQYGVNGGGGCAFIDPANDTWATNLPAGDYLVAVAAGEGMGGAVDLTVTIADAVCGNGNLENNAGEQCDDGNTMAGDGCSASCQFEGNISLEVEPNDMTSNATALTVTPGGMAQTITGGITTVGDVDYFSFTIASGTASVVARTYPTLGDPMSCDFSMDTLLELRDSMGMLVAENDDDDGRMGFCSLLDSTTDMAAGALAAGTYYVVVRHYNDSQAFPTYFLDVSLTTP